MSELFPMIALIFAVLLFNFNQPRTAHEVWTVALQDFYSLPRGLRNPDCNKRLRGVRSWFFLCDIVLFGGTYFTGFFVVLILIWYLRDLLFLRPAVVTTGLVGVPITFVLLWGLIYWRATSFDSTTMGKQRKQWLRTAFAIFSIWFVILVTSGALCLTSLILAGWIPLGAIQHSRVDVCNAIAIATLVLTYLLTMWGLFTYMPYSAAARLTIYAGESLQADEPKHQTDNQG